MFRHLALQRPLAVIDLETTDTNPQTARIVEISVLRLSPSGDNVHRTRRVNPGVPIPAAATAIHGITDADVVNEPPFAAFAASLADFLTECDLCGFNLKRYDLLVLCEEFRGAEVEFSLESRAIIDPMQIYHAYEKRDLASAVRFYLSRDHLDAHTASADTLATAEILDAMVARYSDLPRDVAELHQQFTAHDAIDVDGHFVMDDGQVCLAFGKHRGKALAAVAQEDPGFLSWMIKKDFLADAKDIAARALRDASRDLPPKG